MLPYCSAFSAWFNWIMCNYANKQLISHYVFRNSICTELLFLICFGLYMLLIYDFYHSVLWKLYYCVHPILCPTSVTLSICSSENIVHCLWPGRWERLHSFCGNLTKALKRTQNSISKEGAQLLLIQFLIFGWPTAMRGLVAISLSCSTFILAK